MLRLIMLLMFITFGVQAKVLKGEDDGAKLSFWEWRSDVVSIRLVQRLPDQSRAYFMARKFSPEHAELIAQSCVFQSVFKNIASEYKNMIIRYDLSEWQVTYKNKQYELKLKEEWLHEWREKNVAKSAQIAFEWSLLPTRQRYQYGDYNWGMTTYLLPPGARFDLHLVWYENDIKSQADIIDIQCARDIHPEPVSRN